MIKRIFGSIYAVVAAAVVVSLAIVMAVLYGYFNSIEYSQLSMQTELAANAVEHEGVDYFKGLNTNGYRITWIDDDGTVLYDSEADARVLDNHSEREEVVEAKESGYGKAKRYSASLSQTTLYRAKRLSDQTIIRLSVTQNSIITLIWGMLWPMAIILFAGLVISYIISSRISRGLVKPLESIDIEHPLEVEAYEEFAPFLERMEKQRRQIEDRESKLKKRTSELESVISNMSEALVILNRSNRILSMNSSAMELFDADIASVGESFFKIDHSLVIQELIDASQNGKHVQKECEYNGRTYTISASPVKSGGIVIIAWDISDKADTEKMRREFTANVSHELKTPLQTIMGSSELIKEGMVAGDETKTFASKIYDEAKRLVSLIDDIIRLSQLDEDSEREIKKEDVELDGVALEVSKLLADKAKKLDVRLNTNIKPAKIYGAKSLVYEIIYNLTDNAIKYNKKGGSVLLEIGDENNSPYIKVSDTGIGIPKEDKSRIFERFYRVDKSRSKETGGTGLGLSIVKHAAMLMDAGIDVSSRLGEGTVITISFYNLASECGFT